MGSSEAVAIVLAAGAGTRLASPTPKAFLALGGRPMFLHSLSRIADSGAARTAVLVVPPAAVSRAQGSLSEWPLDLEVTAVVAGGTTRQESVRSGLAAVAAAVDTVICHDAARPFASAALYRAVVEALDPADGAVPVLPSPDTVKTVRGGWVVETIPRDEVGLAQTPQAFRSFALRAAHAAARQHALEATDDAMLVEHAGFKVATIAGEPGNFKITTSDDLRRARLTLAAPAGLPQEP